jgi:hypothetical protein
MSVDYRSSLDTNTGYLSGTASLRFTVGTDLEGSNPMNDAGKVVDEFQFDGVRVVAEE